MDLVDGTRGEASALVFAVEVREVVGRHRGDGHSADGRGDVVAIPGDRSRMPGAFRSSLAMEATLVDQQPRCWTNVGCC